MVEQELKQLSRGLLDLLVAVAVECPAECQTDTKGQKALLEELGKLISILLPLVDVLEQEQIQDDEDQQAQDRK